MVDKEDPGYCGLDNVARTDETDVFYQACKIHDKHYTNHRKGLLTDKSSKKVDEQFYRNMTKIIDALPEKYRKALKIKRFFYYYLARIGGILRWYWIRGIDTKVD